MLSNTERLKSWGSFTWPLSLADVVWVVSEMLHSRSEYSCFQAQLGSAVLIANVLLGKRVVDMSYVKFYKTRRITSFHAFG